MFCGLIPQAQPPQPYLTSAEPTQQEKKKTKEIKKNKKDGRKDRQRFGIFMGLKF